MTSDHNLEQALIDVRKAYRLLANYQQRILELLDFMRERFGATAYHRYQDYSPPKTSNHSFFSETDAGLKFLPLLDSTFLWIRHAQEKDDYVHEHTSGDILISVRMTCHRIFLQLKLESR